MKTKKLNKKNGMKLLYLELALALLVFSISFPFFIDNTFADIGSSVTPTTNLTIGKSNPNILSIVTEAGSVILVPNGTKVVNCSVIIEDFDGDVDMDFVNATFFDSVTSFPEDSDDVNYHYTNDSCVIDNSYGDNYQAKVDCLFIVEYNANPGEWNCSVYVEDLSHYSDSDTNSTTIEELLAFGLPTNIDYGIINATYVSDEREANITNVGNVMVNLSVSGYGLSEGDGYAMVCDYGSSQNISVGFEKYNLTDSNLDELSYSQFEGNYSNLTNNLKIKGINLDYHQNVGINDMVNTTYWRIYVPVGVAGTCNGTILFGAIKAVEN